MVSGRATVGAGAAGVGLAEAAGAWVGAAGAVRVVWAGAPVFTPPEVCVVGDEDTGVEELLDEELFPVGQITGFPGWIPPADVFRSPPAIFSSLRDYSN